MPTSTQYGHPAHGSPVWVVGTGVADVVVGADEELELIGMLTNVGTLEGAVQVTVILPSDFTDALMMMSPAVIVTLPLEPAVIPPTVPGLTVRVAGVAFFTGTLKVRGDAAAFTDDGDPPETPRSTSVIVPPIDFVPLPSTVSSSVIVAPGSVALTVTSESETAPPAETDEGAVADTLTGTEIVVIPLRSQL
jgi:hypothetical protein